MTPEQQSLAREAIRHTQSVYNSSGDRGRIDELIAAFQSDGVLEVPGGCYNGREEIKGFLSSVAVGETSTDLRGSRHHITTARIEFVTDREAQGWTYFFVMRQGVVIQEGTYIDRYAEAGGRWLLAHRRVKMLFDRGSDVTVQLP